MSNRRDEIVDYFMEIGSETVYLGAIDNGDEGRLELFTEEDDADSADMEWRVSQVLPTIKAKRNNNNNL